MKDPLVPEESGVLVVEEAVGHEWREERRIGRGGDGEPVRLWGCGRCGGRTASCSDDAPGAYEKASIPGFSGPDCVLMVVSHVIFD